MHYVDARNPLVGDEMKRVVAEDPDIPLRGICHEGNAASLLQCQGNLTC